MVCLFSTWFPARPLAKSSPRILFSCITKAHLSSCLLNKTFWQRRYFVLTVMYHVKVHTSKLYIYIYLMTRRYELWTFLSLSVPVSPLFLNCAPFLSSTPSELYPRTLPCGQLSIPVKLPSSVGWGSRSHTVTLPLPEDVHRAGNKVSLTKWRHKFHILFGWKTSKKANYFGTVTWCHWHINDCAKCPH